MPTICSIRPNDDYQYSFPPYTQQPKVHLDGERLRLDEGVMLVDDATLVLALRVKSTWLGRFFDPVVELAGGDNPDRQTFERGVERPALPQSQWSGCRCCRKVSCVCAGVSADCSASRCCGHSSIRITAVSG